MTKETEQLDYNELLSDMSSLIREQGAQRVAKDFLRYFPTQAQELFDALLMTKQYREVPALFKPRNV